MPLRSFKGCKRYNKEKGNGEKQCYGSAVFLHVYKLFIRDAERENALSIDFHYIGFVMIKSAIIFIA